MLTAPSPDVAAAPSRGRSGHVRSVYERAAGGYDMYYRRLWIAAAGGKAEQAMLDQIAAALAPLESPRVLDAGAGTGALSRELALLLPDVHPVLVDLSPAMLARGADLGDPRAVASVTALPFPDGTFDAVVCAWVIETVDEPHAAVTEFLRVLRPGGRLVYSFCSRPSQRRDRWRTGPLRAIVHGFFAGHFLTAAQTPFHDCDMSSRTTYAGGVVTVVSLGTCCTVGDASTPGNRNTPTGPACTRARSA